MSPSQSKTPWAWLGLALLGCTSAFVLATSIADEIGDAATAGLPLVVAFLLAAAASGFAGPAPSRAKLSDVVLAVAGGVALLWGAPFFALTMRLTDSPPGAEALWFTTTVWGLAAVLAAFAIRAERPSVTAGAAALASTAGAAALLANWERPSSFSPFVRAADREVGLLLAALLFAAAALALVRAIKRLGTRRTLIYATGSAALVGLAGVLAAAPSVAAVARESTALALLGLSTGAFAVGWVRASARAGVTRSAPALLLAPVALTGLSVVERATGSYGPTPIVWPPALAGAALCVAGGAVVALSSGAVVAPLAGKLAGTLRAGGALACLLALAALFAPAMRGSVEGILGQGFSASWSLLGVESAATWAVFSAAVLAAAAAWQLTRTGAGSAVIAAASASLVGVAAAVPLAAVPLRTWTRWIPADVQQAYGTEYARIDFTATNEPVRLAAALVSLGVAVAVLVVAIRVRKRPAATTTEENE